jgi:5-methylcytosine-specific restriction endonuclease McrA
MRRRARARPEATAHRRWRWLLWRLQGYRCARCGRRLRWPETTLDHVRPTAAGGDDTVSNYQVLCARCNTAKGDAWEED